VGQAAREGNVPRCRFAFDLVRSKWSASDTMGRQYAQELLELPLTYQWARTVDVSLLKQGLACARTLPLFAIGSGGSFSIATLAASLHESATGRPARALTPMEAMTTPLTFRGSAVLLVSARGTNSDILQAFHAALALEPTEIIVLTLSENSALAQCAAMFESVRLPAFAPPVKKDGYLATNSLLAMNVLLARGYGMSDAALPAAFETFIPKIDTVPVEAWRRSTIIALHGSSTRSAAIDLESKFSEAALANVHVVDFRNFGHGRHLWLERRASESFIVSFAAAGDERTAETMLRLVPARIPRLSIRIDDTDPSIAAVRALLVPIILAGSAGAVHGIDIGRPHVPTFGRRMYRQRMASVRVPLAHRFVERKTRARRDALEREGTLDAWTRALATFQRALARTSFSGIVFDYDGTLCTANERFTGCRTEIAHELQRLLDGGIGVAIATGRGKSVRNDLRAKLREDSWDRVIVGYYNGSDIALLSDTGRPTTGTPSSPALQRIREELQQCAALNGATITARPKQITVEVNANTSLASVWDMIAQLVLTRPASGVTVVRSTHSIDLLDADVSKRAVVRALEDQLRQRRAVTAPRVLSIGDQGRWPGNDCALLQEPLSLSVDETSSDERTCWNLAPIGYRQAQAVVYYLKSIAVKNGKARVRLTYEGSQH